MNILVLNRAKIKDYYSQKKHIVISIYDPTDSEGPAEMNKLKSRLDVLYLGFHDIDERHRKMEQQGFNHTEGTHKYVYMSDLDAKNIVDFVRMYLKDIELIICQCDAGISRSAGVAAALAKCINGDDTFYFKNYLPNMLVYNKVLKEWEKI